MKIGLNFFLLTIGMLIVQILLPPKNHAINHFTAGLTIAMAIVAAVFGFLEDNSDSEEETEWL